MLFIIGLILSAGIIFGLYKIYELHKEEVEHRKMLAKLNGVVMSSHLELMEKVHKSAKEKLEELKQKEMKES